VVGVDQLGAVASESDICSRIGTDLLKRGGNAADAMVGTTVCVGVVGMYHSGKTVPQLETSYYSWGSLVYVPLAGRLVNWPCNW
jgi:gamma-glutamyltranspeptidase